MTLPRPDLPTASLAISIAPSLAAVLAVASLGAFQADPGASAETTYLALAAGVVLVAAGALGAKRGTPTAEAVAGPLLVVVAAWTLPVGPARGAVVLTLVAGTLAVAALRLLPRVAAEGPADGDNGTADRLPALPVLALALGLQALLRGGEILLSGDAGWQSVLRGAVLFAVFPAVGAAAVLALARLQGRRRALLAAAAVLLVGPGFRPATLAALVALAAAPALLSRPDALPGGSRTARGLRWTGLVLLAAPFAWDPRAAGAALVAGLAAGPRRDAGSLDAPADRPPSDFRAWAPAALAAAALALASLFPGREPGEAVALAALVPLAVPVLALPGREGAPRALAALLLAFAAGRGVLVEGALAAPAALAALAVPRRGSVAAVQGVWSGALLAASSLLGAYPWLRPEPLRGALGLLGLPPTWPGALAAVAGAAGLAGLALVLARTRSRWGLGDEGTAGRIAVVGLTALVLLRVPSVGATPLEARVLVLDRDRPSWTAPMGAEADRVRTVVLDSTLAHAAELPAGTPVATLRLREPGRPDRVWTVRAGSDTGEWAADRPDLRGSRPPAPRPWSSWVAGEGTFFVRRYRARHTLPEPAAPERLKLTLRPDLPPRVVLTVYHLELRP